MTGRQWPSKVLQTLLHLTFLRDNLILRCYLEKLFHHTGCLKTFAIIWEKYIVVSPFSVVFSVSDKTRSKCSNGSFIQIYNYAKQLFFR